MWLWARTTRSNLVGDCRQARGEVLLTVGVPRERLLLLSHFDDWHSVLNRLVAVPLLPGESYRGWSTRFEGIRDAWDERVRAYRDPPIDEWPVGLRGDLEESWLSILDPAAWGPGTPCVQATAHELHAHQVVHVSRIA